MILENLKKNKKNFATKDDIKRLEERFEKIEEAQENFITADIPLIPSITYYLLYLLVRSTIPLT